jgi:hypothetical protein
LDTGNGIITFNSAASSYDIKMTIGGFGVKLYNIPTTKKLIMLPFMLGPVDYAEDFGGSFGVTFKGTAAELAAVPAGIWTPAEGDLWYDTANDVSYTFNGSTWGLTGLAGDSYVMVPDNTSYAVLLKNSGKTHIMKNLTSSQAINLPTPTVGAHFTFVYCGAAEDDTQRNFETGSGTNYYIGGLMGANESTEAITSISSNGTTNARMHVTRMLSGSKIELFSDGTLWYVTGYVTSTSATPCSFSNHV